MIPLLMAMVSFFVHHLREGTFLKTIYGDGEWISDGIESFGYQIVRKACLLMTDGLASWDPSWLRSLSSLPFLPASLSDQFHFWAPPICGKTRNALCSIERGTKHRQTIDFLSAIGGAEQPALCKGKCHNFRVSAVVVTGETSHEIAVLTTSPF